MGKRKKELRTGYTTGACAAAASKAAAIALSTQQPVDAVEVFLPAGEMAKFKIAKCDFDANRARCSVVKDAGDDPDVTHGAEIIATLRWTGKPGLLIERGEGVGLVTKTGLGLPVGSPAINPVPRSMIAGSVEDILAAVPNAGVEVTISVSRGAELAKKTLNERLGIVGGISILGTTGIVRPFSTSAYKTCVAQALDVAVANGCAAVVLTTGGRTEKFARCLLSLPEEAFIQMGDFVGFALKQCAVKDVRETTIVAMVGKLSKIAAGNFQTHADHSRVDTDFLAGITSSCGVPPSVVDEVRQSNTARHFSEIMFENRISQVFERICEVAAASCRIFVGGRLNVECIMVGFNGDVWGRAGADS